MAAKILAQATGANTLADLYTVPAGREAVTSTAIFYNFGPGPASLTLAVARAGAGYTSAQIILRNFPLAEGQRLALTEGWTLAAGDVLRWETRPEVSGNIFGSEIGS